ncbi:hypothetical protein ACH5RR_013468 [Cinchona calisaya]|uniref:Uncharacterized protein n=1 Tax=Cinchona calisaya TaxID=153742 RepID=A0ABD3A046_9GENT
MGMIHLWKSEKSINFTIELFPRKGSVWVKQPDISSIKLEAFEPRSTEPSVPQHQSLTSAKQPFFSKGRHNRKKIIYLNANSKLSRILKENHSTLPKLRGNRKQVADQIHVGRNQAIQQLCTNLLSQDEGCLVASEFFPKDTEVEQPSAIAGNKSF